MRGSRWISCSGIYEWLGTSVAPRTSPIGWMALPEWAWPIQEALIGVGFCASLPVFAREFWHQRGTVLDRMAAIAFPVYLIHIIIIYVLQELMETTILGAGMKFATVATLGVLLSFVLSHYLKRVPHLNRVL